MNSLKNNWWKYLGVILIIYVLVAGFKIPLKPGILSFYPTQSLTGTIYDVNIKGYNTHFENENTKAWIKLDDENLIKANHLEAHSENELTASFVIPYDLEIDSKSSLTATLIVDNDIDGFALYPEMLRIKENPNPDSSLVTEFYGVDSITQIDGFAFPFRNILYETIRNTFFHVAIWFAMFLLLMYSCYCSVLYLIKRDFEYDRKSFALTSVALWFGIAGILTGSIWAKHTWGTYWTDDIKLNMSAIAMLIYFAYWILRTTVSDVDSRARIASIYNLFAFACLMILVMVIPRMTDSLHPGNGGNPAMGGEDLDNTLRAVFYPAIIGYTLIGLWISQILYRVNALEDKQKLRK